MAEPLVALERVSHFYGAKLVFKDVSFAVEPGAVWLVVGPNGAGKSTLLAIMSGLRRPAHGRVVQHVEQEDVGYLGHNTFLYDRLTALQNLAFWAKMQGIRPSHDDLIAALEAVGLGKAADEPAGGFSRGMAQRLSLARVFLRTPKLVYLDEPATGLDARSTEILRSTIGRVRDEGSSLVWVSHFVSRDLEAADMVVHLSGGRAAYVGPAHGFTPEGDIC
jgi:heme exporter protein A